MCSKINKFVRNFRFCSLSQEHLSYCIRYSKPWCSPTASDWGIRTISQHLQDYYALWKFSVQGFFCWYRSCQMLKKVNPWQILLSTSAGRCTVTSHNTDLMKRPPVSKQPRNSSTLILSYSKTANKILGKWKWFCTNQIRTQICHTPICPLAKHRNLENQVRKEQNYPAAVTAAHKNKRKCNSSLFLF